jgi:hypothetical protein
MLFYIVLQYGEIKQFLNEGQNFIIFIFKIFFLFPLYSQSSIIDLYQIHYMQKDFLAIICHSFVLTMR